MQDFDDSWSDSRYDSEDISIALDRLAHPAKRWTLEELERGLDLNSTLAEQDDASETKPTSESFGRGFVV